MLWKKQRLWERKQQLLVMILSAVLGIDARERSSQLLEMLNLQIEHLTEEQQKSFTDLLAKHTDIFAQNWEQQNWCRYWRSLANSPTT